MKRSRLYDLRAPPESPGFLVPGRLRVGISERIDGQGVVVTPLDEKQVIAEVRPHDRRVRHRGSGDLFSQRVRQPEHEERSRRFSAGIPDLLVSVSSPGQSRVPGIRTGLLHGLRRLSQAQGGSLRAPARRGSPEKEGARVCT